MKPFFLILMLLSLASCSTGSTTITGPVTEAIALSKVQLYYSTPGCALEAVASIEIAGGYFSRASLIDAFREQAAALGANAVQVLHLQTVSSNEYFGTARALRCL